MTSPERTAVTPPDPSRPRRAWNLFVNGLREIVWDDLRDGVLDLKGLSKPTRFLVFVGFGLLLAMLVVLFVSSSFRFGLLVPLRGGLAERGAVMPASLLPVTLFALAAAWSFILLGALHARRLIRVGAVGLYLFFALLWTSQITNFLNGLIESVVAWGLVFAVPVFFVMRWRREASVALEFLILFALVTVTFSFAQGRGAGAWEISGIGTIFQSMDVAIEAVAFLALPLFFLIGIDIAEFTFRLSDWTATTIGTRLPLLALRIVLALVSLLLLYYVTSGLISDVRTTSLSATLPSYAGAFVVPVLVWAVWFVIFRGEPTPTTDEMADEARRAAPSLVILYFGTLVVLFVVFLIVSTLALVFGSMGLLEGAAALDSRQLTGATEVWISVVSILSIAGAFWFARRGNRLLALYLGIVGANGLWNNLTAVGNTLDYFTWDGSGPVVFWFVLCAFGIGGYWLLRGRLTPVLTRNLLLILLATALFGQTSFIEDPFSPLLGFSGIAIIAVGVIWDALSFGAWANSESVKFPRTSRIFLYLGYVLFGVAVVNWSVATHDLEGMSNYTGGLALAGFNLLGKPLLYAIFAVLLFIPQKVEEEKIEKSVDTPQERQ